MALLIMNPNKVAKKATQNAISNESVNPFIIPLFPAITSVHLCIFIDCGIKFGNRQLSAKDNANRYKNGTIKKMIAIKAIIFFVRLMFPIVCPVSKKSAGV